MEARKERAARKEGRAGEVGRTGRNIGEGARLDADGGLPLFGSASAGMHFKLGAAELPLGGQAPLAGFAAAHNALPRHLEEAQEAVA